ncbi:uncharacterized protein [Nicotiana tomentosiformis]|uniref:uncharacterized protein n=1 Tax=Nicotiana tomentosiformis TaxID=4098 RepID=UPI00388C571C
MGVTETSGVSFTTFQLRGATYQWWRAYELDSPSEEASLTWTQFSDIFLREYVPQSLKDAWGALFEQLRQGAMTMSEYAVQFSDLARHAPTLLATIRERAPRAPQGPQAMIAAPATTPPTQPAKGGGRTGRGHPRGGGEARYYALPSRMEAVTSDAVITARARQGRGYIGRPVHSAIPAASGATTTTRPQDPYYEPPMSSVPPVQGASSGQSNRSGPSKSHQTRPPRACFECGDTRHLVNDFPRFSRGAPPQLSQAPRAPPGPQTMITALATIPPAQPARDGG